jgi:hypothetical protein
MWEELIAFRAVARKLTYSSVSTAALLAWEWLQREEHVFGAFEITHYRPKERPNSVKNRSSKEWRGSVVAAVR